MKGGGGLIWAMPESKHSFFWEVFPYYTVKLLNYPGLKSASSMYTDSLPAAGSMGTKSSVVPAQILQQR